MSSDPKQPGAPERDDALAQELASWRGHHAEAPASPPELSSLYGDLEAELAHDRGARAWLRSRPTPLRLLIAFAVLLAPVGLTALLWMRPDAAVYPAARMIAVAGFLFASLVAAVVVALRPLYRPALPRWVAPATVAVAVIGVLALYALPSPPSTDTTPAAAPSASVARAWPCLSIGLSVGAVVLSLLLALDRGGIRRALALAAASGLCANLVLQFHCPNTARAHMLLGHFGALALLLLGAALVARVAQRR